MVGEDPELDAQALPPHRPGHLPDHPADDRPAGRHEFGARPAVASEIYPAGQDRRPGRCRRRAAGRLALPRSCARWCRATPRSWARWRRPRRSMLPAALRRPRPAARRQRRGSRPPRPRRAASLRAGRAIPIGPGGEGWARQRPASPPWPHRRQIGLGHLLAGYRPPSSTPMTGRPDLPAYLHYDGAAAGHGDDRAQPRLPGPVLAGCSPSSACRRPSHRRRRVLRRRRLPQGRAHLRTGSPRSARPTPRRSRPRKAAWASTACSAVAPRC